MKQNFFPSFAHCKGLEIRINPIAMSPSIAQIMVLKVISYPKEPEKMADTRSGSENV